MTNTPRERKDVAFLYEVLRFHALADFRRRGIPALVSVLSARGARERGLEGNLLLQFPTAVHGPLLLGRARHLGGGLFIARERT